MEQNATSVPTQAGFTPGPWTAEDYRGKINVYCDDATGSIVANAGPFTYAPRLYDEAFANARLISAAPDLYRELNHLVSLLQPLEDAGSLNVPGLATLNGARAALAKAGVQA